MPNVEEHVRFCVGYFGAGNRELCYMVNSWIDAPSRTIGSYHRTQRHKITTPFEASMIYGDKDLSPTAKNLLIAHMVLQHLRLDGLITPAQEKDWKWEDTLIRMRKATAAIKLKRAVLIPLGTILLIVGCSLLYQPFLDPAADEATATLEFLLFTFIGSALIVSAYGNAERSHHRRRVRVQPNTQTTTNSTNAFVRMENAGQGVKQIMEIGPAGVRQWTEPLQQDAASVKVRCVYCGKLYKENLDACPHCGGKR